MNLAPASNGEVTWIGACRWPRATCLPTARRFRPIVPDLCINRELSWLAFNTRVLDASGNYLPPNGPGDGGVNAQTMLLARQTTDQHDQDSSGAR